MWQKQIKVSTVVLVWVLVGVVNTHYLLHHYTYCTCYTYYTYYTCYTYYTYYTY